MLPCNFRFYIFLHCFFSSPSIVMTQFFPQSFSHGKWEYSVARHFSLFVCFVIISFAFAVLLVLLLLFNFQLFVGMLRFHLLAIEIFIYICCVVLCIHAFGTIDLYFFFLLWLCSKKEILCPYSVR